MSANRETKEVAVQRSGSNQTDEMTIDLSELFYRILDHWVLVVLIGLLGAILAFGITRFMITPKYESTAKIYVLSSSDSVVNLSDMQIGSYLASDYQEVFNTREVHEQVISNLRLPDTFEQLKKKLKVSNLTGTRILSIMVEETDPNTAAAIANEFASVASDYIATVMVTDRPTVLSTAVPAAGPSSPNLVKNVFIGAVAGALLVIAIITIATLTDDKIKSADQLTNLTGLPVFSQIPDTKFDVLESLVKKVKPDKHEDTANSDNPLDIRKPTGKENEQKGGVSK